MSEFVEYRALDHRDGTWIARKLPAELNGNCVVSHPDAGGHCEREIVYEVYGLPFCEVHGLEANAGALARLYHEAADEFERMDNPHADPLQPEVLRVVREARTTAMDGHFRHEKSLDALLREAYPLTEGLEERVDPDTVEWVPGDLAFGLAPVDVWADQYWAICSVMLHAQASLAPELVREIEPVREHVAAQYAFAEVYSERKLGPREERQPK